MCIIKIFLCRHGRTQHNENGVVQGHKDIELNEKGERQAEKLGKYLEKEGIDHIYSSPLVRAKKTAETISEIVDVDFEALENLKEVDQGVYEGKSSRKMMEDMWNAEVKNHLWAPENGESMEDTRKRAMEIFESLEESHEGENIAIIAHGGFNKTALLGVLGHSSKNFNRVKQDNCCVNIISSSKDFDWVLESMNYTDHLN